MHLMNRYSCSCGACCWRPIDATEPPEPCEFCGLDLENRPYTVENVDEWANSPRPDST